MTAANSPASIRNRNPGAMYPGPSARRFGSTGHQVLKSRDGTHKIATFPSHRHGAAALFDLLARDYAGQSVASAVRRWCGGHYVTTYLRVIEAQCGIRGEDRLSLALLHDPAQAIGLARAMAWQEAGREYPMSEAEWRAAHDLAFPLHERSASWTAVATASVPVAERVEDEVPPRWDPHNDLPSPRPETRAASALQGSRKWRLLGGVRWALGALGLGGLGVNASEGAGLIGGAGQAIRQLAADHALLLMVGGVVLGMVAVEMLRHLTREDLERGDYVPSKESDR